MRSECREVEDFAGRFDHMDKFRWELEISSFFNFFTQRMLQINLLVFIRAFSGI
jgi:hypothetical protein